jgi:phage recombination protein Bet
MTELTIHRSNSDTVSFEPISGERKALLKRTIAKDLTDDEMDLFVAVCNRRRLDPFVKQIHAVKRRQWNSKLNDGKGGYEEVMVIQTGIDGYRLVADRTHQRDGVEGPWWCDDSGEWRDVWLADGHPSAAKIIVYRKGHTRGYVGIAHWAEYVQTYKDKQGNWVPVQMWQSMPAGQLAKCAEALASRKAFPEELGGIYTDEEMGQAEEGPIAGAVTPTPAPAMAATGSVPTIQQIQRLRSKDEATDLVRAHRGFSAYVSRAITEMHGIGPEVDWWPRASVRERREVLEYAVELADQQEHETVGAGPSPDPAPAPTSDPASGSVRGRQNHAGSDEQGGDADGG